MIQAMPAPFFRRTMMWVLLALAAGTVLRVWFIHAFPQIEGDSLLYGDLAKNWLIHGVYGFTSVASISPTLIRLPGYPAFLALCFKVFGIANYQAVLYVQAVIDLGSCLLVAAFVRRAASSPRAGMIALWLAVLCPFTANYVATALTETLSIFCVALGFYAFLLLVDRPGWPAMLLVTFACCCGALLRPDGAILTVVLVLAWVAHVYRRPEFRVMLPPALACACLAILPFVAWTGRNWRVFHVFQPLVPRSATDPGDFGGPGFERWTKTWLADFASTYEIYWNVPGDTVEIAALPCRAFDSPAEYEQTRSLFAQYNRHKDLDPAIDAGFAALAAERVRAHPVRYYVILPMMRLADMWLRPRVEMLNIELRWWQYGRHRAETRFAVAYGALNLAILAAAAVGAWYWPRFRAPMLAYLILRSLLLATLAAPEPRYTLECFPILLAFAALALSRWMKWMNRRCSDKSLPATKAGLVPG